jgi:carbamoyl-phosphate synthase large subunit
MLSKRYRKVLILGSGGLKIGQAGEFDYSGSQAIKALQEDGIKTVVVNPNIATVQTDRGFADTVYYLPLTAHFVERVIEKEKPDGILLSFGGQTALNLGLELEASGFLKAHRVKVLGTPVSAIRTTEDRGLFARALKEIEVKTAKSKVVGSVSEGLAFAKKLGFPVMVRAGFSLGGLNSGRVGNEAELRERIRQAMHGGGNVLIEEYLGGWKEIEYEIVRDSADNCIAVCNMENFDPMGIHTGESIVVAPSQTLNNQEYHFLRAIALKTVRHLGIVGECNIQYALNPKTGDYRVIEVNARLSRSSALASKATGYPLAFVAAKIALGYTLDTIRNSVTKVTSAMFEPALDYIVVKVPRWDLTKFDASSRRIGSEMKSVGEVMAIGRSFEEALQKALRMLSIGADGLTGNRKANLRVPDPRKEVREPTDRRVFAVAQALEKGASVKALHKLSGIDPWFLSKLERITKLGRRLAREKLSRELLREAKRLGFSDRQIGLFAKKKTEAVRKLRMRFGVVPSVKQIDTLAGEFPAKTNYLYMTYGAEAHDVEKEAGEAALVLGGGPYSIGSSVEFDWCCVQAVKTLHALKKRSIIVNCNPETVSTDYDMADRLYFEELSLERVRDIYEFEHVSAGALVSVAGQIPNTLAPLLSERGVKILGTSAADIDRAEDRNKFSAVLDELSIKQPPWASVSSLSQAAKAAASFGYPVIIRPSYVLSGTAMKVAFDEATLRAYLKSSAALSEEHPVVVSKFVQHAREVEMDGVAMDGDIVCAVLSEHVQNAGVHSGDATVVIPAQKTYLETARRVQEMTGKIVKELSITGPFNIQFVACDNDVQVIECNLRASRSFPFVSKATGVNLIDAAVRAMLGKRGEAPRDPTHGMRHVAVKTPQFSYSRIRDADPLGYVEMASTGEVACFGDTYDEALLKSAMASWFTLPKKRVLLSIGGDIGKRRMLDGVQKLADRGIALIATEGTAAFLRKNGIPCKTAYKIHTGKKPNVADYIGKENLDLIINIPVNYLTRDRSDGYEIRRKAIDENVPLISNLQIAEALIDALTKAPLGTLAIKSEREYFQPGPPVVRKKRR